MIKNYFMLGLRNLRRNKVTSSINIIGLSLAVGCAIAIFLLLQVINTSDDFHVNGDRIFLVGHTVERDGDIQMWGTSPIPLGPALANDFPQLERAVRVVNQTAKVHSKGIGFRETVSFADVGFLDMFTFPLHRGQIAAFADPTSVIISKEMADKYFGNSQALGQTLFVTFSNGRIEPFIVGGIAEVFPSKASFTFDLLVNFDRLLDAGLERLEDWNAMTHATFVQFTQASDSQAMASQLDPYVAAQNGANPEWSVQSFFLDSIQNPDWLNTWKIEKRAIQAPLLWESLTFGVVGLLVLLVSCFNYITISLGSAARRLKEIGIRKTAGAEKMQLVMQFLSENLLLCLAALIGGLVFAATVTVPVLDRMVTPEILFDFLENMGLWIFLAGMLAFLGLVSGAYPAFYISSFQPIVILRGKRRLAEKKGLTRTLMTIQFALTILTICISTFIASLDKTLLGGDWGLDEENILVVPVSSPEQFSILSREVAQLHGVGQVAGAEHHIGHSRHRESVLVEGEEREVLFFGVGSSYLSTMGVSIAAGRAFGKEFSADNAHSVVVNQTFVRQRKWTDPIGREVRINNQDYSVVGVIEDFLVHPIMGKEQSVILGLADPERFDFLTLSVADAGMDHVVASVRQVWEQKFPEVSFEYFAQKDVFVPQSLHGLAVLLNYLAAFALFISCMGLYGMAAQRAELRTKEIGVRKAMGASAVRVILLVNRNFLALLGISTLIATPIFYFGLGALLFFAPVEIPIGAKPFLISNSIVFSLAALSLITQTQKLVRVNPAEVLRDE